MIDQIIKNTISQCGPIVREFLLAHWLYFFGFFAVVIAGIVLQIIMLRSGGQCKLPAFFNRIVGSLTYLTFFLIFLLIGYWIFGTRVIDDIWFSIFGILSFPATGFFLRAIGFWYY